MIFHPPTFLILTGTLALATLPLTTRALEYSLPAPAANFMPTGTTAPAVTTAPAEDPAQPLSTLVGKLSALDTLTAPDLADFARATLTYNEALQSSKQPLSEKTIRDALAAVDMGRQQDPKSKTADWDDLQARLENRTITFHGAKGKIDPLGANADSKTLAVKYDQAIATLATPNYLPKRKGYTFQGYYTDAKYGVKYFNANLTRAGTAPLAWTTNIDLYAQWLPIDLAITFDANDGAFPDATASKTLKVKYDDNLASLGPDYQPTRLGYVFQGFYTAAAAGTKYFNANLSVNTTHAPAKWSTNLKLFAQWQSEDNQQQDQQQQDSQQNQSGAQNDQQQQQQQSQQSGDQQNQQSQDQQQQDGSQDQQQNQQQQSQQNPEQQNQQNAGQSQQQQDQQQEQQNQQQNGQQQEQPQNDQTSPQNQHSQNQQQQNQQQSQNQQQQPQNQQNAFSDMQKTEEQKNAEKQNQDSQTQELQQKQQQQQAAQSVEMMQQVGGDTGDKQKTPVDPRMVIPLQKLDQVRDTDTPGVIFQRMQARQTGTTQPLQPKGKDW